MLKKAKAEFGTRQIEQARELSQSVLNSSHQIWLAGLGAFARAQQEGMKMFETLVRQGERLEVRTRQAAADTASAARGAASAKAKEMQQMAGGTWDKLEQVFEDRVARALSKLGVHTHNDVQQLVERVDALSEAVNRLIAMSPEGAGPTAPARGKRASAGRKSGRVPAGSTTQRKSGASGKRTAPAAAARKAARPSGKQGAKAAPAKRASSKGSARKRAGATAVEAAARPAES